MSLKIEPTSQPDAVIVRIGKHLDFRNAPTFKAVCSERVKAGVQHFILDFSGTGILDSTALGAVFSVYRQISPQDGQMLFVGVSGAVKMVVEMTKLDKVFGQYPSVEAALGALASPAA